MSKIWFKQSYDYTGESGNIGNAPIGILFTNGVAVCSDPEKVAWFQNKSAFIIEASEDKSLNVFEKMDTNTLKEIAAFMGISIQDTDTKKEFIGAIIQKITGM